MDNNCGNCKYKDEFNFCEKLVVDTRWCVVEDGKRIRSNYISEREDGDSRPSFIVPMNFKCVYYEGK